MSKVVSHVPPQQRPLPAFKDSEAAWALVVENINTIVDRFRWFTHQAMGRPVDFVGTPLGPDFRWTANGHFLGREATDFLEEIWGGTLEAAVRALDRYDSKRAKVSTFLEKVARIAVAKDVQYWQATSSRQQEDGVPWELSFVSNPDENDIGQYLSQVQGIDQDNDERLGRDPIEELIEGPKVNDAAIEKVAAIREMLTEREFEVLERHSNGCSLSQIAGDMGLASKSSAQRALNRALRKTREVGA